jgi:hypothetical protein
MQLYEEMQLLSTFRYYLFQVNTSYTLLVKKIQLHLLHTRLLTLYCDPRRRYKQPAQPAISEKLLTPGIWEKSQSTQYEKHHRRKLYEEINFLSFVSSLTLLQEQYKENE